MLKLKPCPFCGGDDLILIVDGKYEHINCRDCGAGGSVAVRNELYEKTDPYEYWNERVETENDE